MNFPVSCPLIMCFLFLRKVALTDQNNKHVFVRRNCKELWSNLRRYLVNGHGDLFLSFYISKHCRIVYRRPSERVREKTLNCAGKNVDNL